MKILVVTLIIISYIISFFSKLTLIVTMKGRYNTRFSLNLSTTCHKKKKNKWSPDGEPTSIIAFSTFRMQTNRDHDI